VYLVVSALGNVRGAFVAADGTPLGWFSIQPSANHGHFPRVAFSPEADNGMGGFLVTWHESDLPGGGTSVHGRMVSKTQNGPYGADTVLGANGSWWEAGAAVAYSTVSHEFLVVWQGPTITGVRVTNNAAPKSAPFDISPAPGYERDPSVAYNPSADEFMVVYAGFNDPGNFAFVDSRRVQGGTNNLIGAPVRLIQTVGTYVTDVTYNSATNKYLTAWYGLPAATSAGRVLNADGSLNGGIITLSNRWRAYDALSVAYNTKTDTFFLVSHSTTAEDGGVEIASSGTPVDNGFIVTAAGGNGNFYPRLAPSTNQPDWLISTANNFTSTMVQRVAGTAVTGGSGPPPPPPPPPAPPLVSNPRMWVDGPSNNSTVSGAIDVVGWALDLGHPDNSGVIAVHVWAFPTSGATPIFMGAATLGVARPDVAGAFAASRFNGSGFHLAAAALPPGVHDIAVYALSAISGTFNNSQVIRVSVTAPLSIPRMAVDLPVANQVVSQNFRVAGWALDLGASSGTGIDTIHIWAYPVSGATPTLLGVPSMFLWRPDVAGAFGATRHGSSGFNLDVFGKLPPGEYYLVIYAHSLITGTFNNASVVRIRVV
jgi:hypothetical protein